MEHSPLLNRIRELVLSGELEPGARVTEQAMAARLGLSRTPIRNALPALAAEGFLVPVGRRGYAVKGFSSEESVTALDIRAMLEGYAARSLAEEGLSAEMLTLLRHCLDEGDRLFRQASFGRDEEQRYGAINGRFHCAIVEVGAPDLVKSIVVRLNRVPFVSPDVIVFDQVDREERRDLLLRAHHQHHDIVDALRDGDGARAEALFREHAHRQKRSMFERHTRPPA